MVTAVWESNAGATRGFQQKHRRSSRLPQEWTVLSKTAAAVHHDKAVWFSGV